MGVRKRNRKGRALVLLWLMCVRMFLLIAHLSVVLDGKNGNRPNNDYE
jgi:hypothetical protein